MTAPSPDPFCCDVEPARGLVRVIPRGELDLATADIVDARLRELFEAGFDRFELDLRALSFLDSCGLTMVLRWHDLSRRDELELRLVPGPPVVQRVFEITGTLERLPFVDGATHR